jgi:hypothetical protein
MSTVAKVWRPALAVGSAVAGAVLGAMVQNVLDSQLRVLAAIAVMLAVFVVGLSTALIAQTDGAKETNLRTAQQVAASAVAMMRGSSELRDRLDRNTQALAQQLGDISRQFGLRAHHLLISDVNRMKTISESRSSQLILGVKTELLVLDFLSKNGRWPDESMSEAHSREHFDALVAHIRTLSPPFAYKRIVQVDDTGNAFRGVKTQSMLDHCRDMLTLRDEKGYHVSLRVSRKRFPYKFVLIDRAALILQLQEYDADGDNLTVWGDLIITDPQGDMVSVFQNIWNEIDDDPATRTATRDDLGLR